MTKKISQRSSAAKCCGNYVTKMRCRHQGQGGQPRMGGIFMSEITAITSHVALGPDLAGRRPDRRLRGALRINKRRHDRRADRPRSRKCRVRRKLQCTLRNRHHRHPRAACACIHAGAEALAFERTHAAFCHAGSVRARRSLLRPTRRRLFALAWHYRWLVMPAFWTFAAQTLILA